MRQAGEYGLCALEFTSGRCNTVGCGFLMQMPADGVQADWGELGGCAAQQLGGVSPGCVRRDRRIAEKVLQAMQELRAQAPQLCGRAFALPFWRYGCSSLGACA